VADGTEDVEAVNRTLMMLTLAVVFVWGAVAALYVRSAFAANPSKDINRVERVVSKWTPFQTRMVQQQLTGAKFICRLYDDAPTLQSMDSKWQVMVCRKVSPKKTGPKA